ncbi:MAG: Ku protein [Bacillota bacterium]|nr:Ku protein [Bacillota bacterium]
MRPLWRGTISFGLVNIPVKLYSAIQERDFKFRFLHKKDHMPLIYERKCPACETPVPPEEIERAYEYEKGRFVVVENELLTTPGEPLHSIEIYDFVNLAEIDPIFFAKPYYLAPGEGGEKAYFLLRKAMQETKRVAIAKARLRNRESLVALRVYQNALLMALMYYFDEIRSLDEIPELDKKVDLHENEIQMAVNLIGNLAGKFKPEKYEDEYRKTLEKIIESKIAGKEITVPPAAPAPKVVDLVEALRASIDLTKENKTGKEKAKVRKKTAIS